MIKYIYILVLLTVMLLSACASFFLPEEAKLVELNVPTCV